MCLNGCVSKLNERNIQFVSFRFRCAQSLLVLFHGGVEIAFSVLTHNVITLCLLACVCIIFLLLLLCINSLQKFISILAATVLPNHYHLHYERRVVFIRCFCKLINFTCSENTNTNKIEFFLFKLTNTCNRLSYRIRLLFNIFLLLNEGKIIGFILYFYTFCKVFSQLCLIKLFENSIQI